MNASLRTSHQAVCTPADGRAALLEVMMVSREVDTREDILFRQGRGQFHVSSAGHEAMAALAALARPDDWIYGYYRDRALMLARGVTPYDMALGYFAKAASCSGGRQMVNHFQDKLLNIATPATPTGLQCLPAAGTAWGIRREGGDSLVFCSIGDASTRQGEFFEALAFSLQERLPIVFLVEDNGFGISTPTEHLTPLGLGMLKESFLHIIDGRDPFNLLKEMTPIVQAARAGYGPKIAWLKFDRLAAHTASDDHSRYRGANDLREMQARDPILVAQQQLLLDGVVSEEQIKLTREKIRADIKLVYQEAEQAACSPSAEAESHVLSASATPRHHHVNPGFMPVHEEWTMTGALNHTLDCLLKENNKVLLFGEDVEDPKGGVFGLTKGLSTRYPGRVINSPLAEATIAGLASGLCLTGTLPIFELQFADFIGPAFNQIVNQIATLRWRSAGKQKCPLVIYAPCGGYIGGGPWHSQTNESWLAHAPGLKVYMPGNANDAAQLLYSAAYGDDPVIMLLPKNQFQKLARPEKEFRLHPERARIRRTGEHVTIVAWGNCVELAVEAADRLQRESITSDVLDLCSLVPCDWQSLHTSVQKTGRLVVVQEDSKSCSFGQAVISEICSRKETWERLFAPPQLVSRGDVHVGFSRVIEHAVLPDVTKILSGVYMTLGRRP